MKVVRYMCMHMHMCLCVLLAIRLYKCITVQSSRCPQRPQRGSGFAGRAACLGPGAAWRLWSARRSSPLESSESFASIESKTKQGPSEKAIFYFLARASGRGVSVHRGGGRGGAAGAPHAHGPTHGPRTKSTIIDRYILPVNTT